MTTAFELMTASEAKKENNRIKHIRKASQIASRLMDSDDRQTRNDGKRLTNLIDRAKGDGILRDGKNIVKGANGLPIREDRDALLAEMDRIASRYA